MARILVTAESFGYGPIITGLNIVKRLKQRQDGYYIFLGSGVSLEQAISSGLFDQYEECDTFSPECLEKYKGLFKEVDFLLSVENIEGAILGVRLGTKVFYVDNLFWMWSDIPKELYHVDTYFIAQSLDMSENLDRIGNNITNKIIVGPLRNYYGESKEKEPENRVLINFGGAESFLIDQEIITSYYCKLLELIFAELEELHMEDVIVCGGSKLIQGLDAHFSGKHRAVFKSLANQEYLDTLSKSRYVIMSPGLGNFFEALSLKYDVMFVPPINYSQYWQLEAYRELDMGFRMHNWNDSPWFIPIEKYAEEETGVLQVLSNVGQFLKEESSQECFAKDIREYLTGSWEHYGKARKEHFMSYRKDGIGSIVGEIIKRSV